MNICMKKALFLALVSMISVNTASAAPFEYKGILKLETANFIYPYDHSVLILKHIPIELIVDVSPVSNITNKLVIESPAPETWNDPCRPREEFGSVQVKANIEPSFVSTLKILDGSAQRSPIFTKALSYITQTREEKDWNRRATDFILNTKLSVTGFTPLVGQDTLFSYDFSYDNSCGSESTATLQIDAIEYRSNGTVTTNGFEIANAAPSVRIKYSILKKDTISSSQPLFKAEGWIDL